MTAAYKLRRICFPGLLLRFFTVATAVSPITATAVVAAAGGPALRNVHARGTCIVNTTMASHPQDLPLLRYS